MDGGEVKRWIKELLWIVGGLGAFIYVDGLPTRGWLLFIVLVFAIWGSAKCCKKGWVYFALIIVCLAGHFLIDQYGSKNPHSYWSRKSALILQEVEFKGPFIDGDDLGESVKKSLTRSIHLERELHKDSYPDLNWTEIGRDAVWEDAEEFPSKKGLLIAKGIYHDRPAIRLAPLELQYTDENGTHRVIKFSYSSEGASLNNWCSADEDQMPDYNASTTKTFEILIPPNLENKFLGNPKLESFYLEIFRYGYLF